MPSESLAFGASAGRAKARPRWIAWLVLLIALVAIVARAAAGHSPDDIPAGTGFAALDLCTRTMQSGEALEHVQSRYVEPKVDPLPRFWRVDYARGQHVRVSTRLPLFSEPRTALYRPGLGCTIVPPDSSETAVRAQRIQLVPAPVASSAAWPEGDAPAETSLLTPETRALIDRHAEAVFREPGNDPKAAHNATALLVARDRHLVYERYGQGYTRDQPQLGWSMTKTLTALIAGLFAREGKLALDAPVGLSRWKSTPKAAITWRQLLNMAPGLSWFEGYGGSSDATEMLFSRADQGAWAADRPLVDKPGTHFVYSTGFVNIAMLRMRELLGGNAQALYDLYQRELFAPLGIRGGVIEPDASGTPVGGARGILRPLDWLRLGQLVADGGRWNDAQVLPEAWVSFMTSASPADDGYGGFMWRGPSANASVRARLPSDAVWFAGHMGQFVIVVPSQRLVVSRMGVALRGDHDEVIDQVMELVIDLLGHK